MRKIYTLALSLYLFSFSLAFSCADKLVVCKNWESILVSQIMDWREQECQLCNRGCIKNYKQAQFFCGDKDERGMSRGGISSVVSIEEQNTILRKRYLYLNPVENKRVDSNSTEIKSNVPKSTLKKIAEKVSNFSLKNYIINK